MKEGLQVHCLDPNERTIRRLRTELGLDEGAAKVGTSQEIPFPDGTFDCVVMTEVLEHLPGDVQTRTMTEVRRVLRPGGSFLGTVPAREDLAKQRVVCPDCGSRFHRWGHLHSFDEEKLRVLLARMLEVKEIREKSFALLPRRATLFGNLKRAIRLGLLRAGVLGYPPDTLVYFFHARKA